MEPWAILGQCRLEIPCKSPLNLEGVSGGGAFFGGVDGMKDLRISVNRIFQGYFFCNESF